MTNIDFFGCSFTQCINYPYQPPKGIIDLELYSMHSNNTKTLSSFLDFDLAYNNNSDYEVNIINPPGSQEFIGMRFTLSRYEDPTDTASTLDTTGPTFKGYQVRALPATPRQHLIQLPFASVLFSVSSDFDAVFDHYQTISPRSLTVLL